MIETVVDLLVLVGGLAVGVIAQRTTGNRVPLVIIGTAGILSAFLSTAALIYAAVTGGALLTYAVNIPIGFATAVTAEALIDEEDGKQTRTRQAELDEFVDDYETSDDSDITAHPDELPEYAGMQEVYAADGGMYLENEDGDVERSRFESEYKSPEDVREAYARGEIGDRELETRLDEVMGLDDANVEREVVLESDARTNAGDNL